MCAFFFPFDFFLGVQSMSFNWNLQFHLFLSSLISWFWWFWCCSCCFLLDFLGFGSMNVSSCFYICSRCFFFDFLLLVFKINVFSYLISILVVFLLIFCFWCLINVFSYDSNCSYCFVHFCVFTCPSWNSHPTKCFKNLRGFSGNFILPNSSIILICVLISYI
jgi:hypothetical protein